MLEVSFPTFTTCYHITTTVLDLQKLCCCQMNCFQLLNCGFETVSNSVATCFEASEHGFFLGSKFKDCLNTAMYLANVAKHIKLLSRLLHVKVAGRNLLM